MSMSDLFFPGNPGRRNKVIRLYTELIELMRNNFKATNNLIDVLHEHLPGQKFLKINIDHDLTISQNCDRIVTRIKEIQEYIAAKKLKLKENLEHELYKQIMDTKVSFAKKLELGRKIASATLYSIGTITGVGVCAAIHKGKILVSLVDKFSKLRVCAAAGVVVAIAFLALDAIASAIIGAVERGKLEESIQDLEAAKDQFEPVSDEYSYTIMKVVCRIEILLE